MTICIYGNGLTALTLAKVLVNQNIYVDVIYSKKHSNSIQTRTIGVSKNNFEFLEKNIFNIKKLSWELKKIEIFSDNLKKERLISFENNNDQLFSTIKNHELYELLQNQLSQNKYFKSKFVRNSSLSFINKYDLVINCDSNNIITKKYFFKKIIKEYDSYAYTSIIKHKNILNDTAVQVFTKEGPLAFLPISNRETSIVYSVYNSFNKKKILNN